MIHNILFNRVALALYLFLSTFGVTAAQDPFRILFYNVENLFDCQDDSLKNDHDFLPTGANRWTPYRYRDKLTKIAKVIVASGDKQVPDLVGLCEVENDSCLIALTQHSPLKEAGYRYVMTNSPDQRGIDVALLYQRATFKPINQNFLAVPNEQIGRTPTRDILHVAGQVMNGDTLDVFVCHLPSRSGGEVQSEPFRMLAAATLRQAVDSIAAIRSNFSVVIMGDFNDYPTNRSLTEVLRAHPPIQSVAPRALYNLMHGRDGGSYRYRGEWGFLDQFIVSGSLLQPEPKNVRTSYQQVQIMNHPFLLEEDDRYGGVSPYRTYRGKNYHGGYSDHLPICIDLNLY